MHGAKGRHGHAVDSCFYRAHSNGPWSPPPEPPRDMMGPNALASAEVCLRGGLSLQLQGRHPTIGGHSARMRRQRGRSLARNSPCTHHCYQDFSPQAVPHDLSPPRPMNASRPSTITLFPATGSIQVACVDSSTVHCLAAGASAGAAGFCYRCCYRRCERALHGDLPPSAQRVGRQAIEKRAMPAKHPPPTRALAPAWPLHAGQIFSNCHLGVRS